MNWLVTLSKGADREMIQSVIKDLGGQVEAYPDDITVGEDFIISVSAPDNFSKALKKKISDGIQVYPNSDISLF